MCICIYITRKMLTDAGKYRKNGYNLTKYLYFLNSYLQRLLRKYNFLSSSKK